MKKLSTFISVWVMAVAFSVAPANASPDEGPAKQDVLIMKHTILTLWNMGITSPEPMNPEELCRTVILYLLRGQFTESAELSHDYPERFANLRKLPDLF